MEIKNVDTEKTTVQAGEKIKIKFEVWYETSYPYDYPYDYPIATKKNRGFNYGSKTKLRNGKWRETVSNL